MDFYEEEDLSVDRPVHPHKQQPMTEDDVIDAFYALAKEEGHTEDNDAVFVVNIGSPTDAQEHYSLSLAWCDYVHHALRRALAEKRIDVLTWHTAKEALFSAKIIPSGKDPSAAMTPEMKEYLRKEEDIAQQSITDMCYISKWLRANGKKDLSEKMDRAMNLLHIGDETPYEEPHPTEIEYASSQIVDGFQRFIVLGVGGVPLIEQYQQMAKERWNVCEEKEQGYVVLSATRRDSSRESVADFVARNRRHGHELLKKIGKKLARYPNLCRISFHLASFGEVIPVGYVPEEQDVVTIDSRGCARCILSVADFGAKLGEEAPGKRRDPEYRSDF